jgi:hypothetical protein
MITQAVLPSFPKEKKFILITWICFIAIAGFAMLQHELWRDEWQAWLIVKNSPDLPSLFQKIRYEGHPALWFLLLWLVQRISDDAASMQILHFLIAASTVFVWLRFAPLSKLLRALFVFGYFPLFEFTVISRNYGLGLLLLFLFLTCYSYRRNDIVLQSILLALMMQTNLFAFLIAAAMSFRVVLTAFINRKTYQVKSSRYVAALIIIASGVTCCYFTVRPPADHFFGYLRESFNWKDAKSALPLFWQGMVPVPKPELHFWNTNVLLEMKMRFALYLALIVGLLIIFRKNTRILATFLVGAILISILLYLKNLHFIRHTGSFYLLFIACIWLLYSESFNDTLQLKKMIIKGISNLLIISIFITHIIGAAFAIAIDWIKPFTAAAATAKYIRDNQLDSLPLAVENDFIAISITGYLDKPAYQLKTGKVADYVTWNKSRMKTIPEDEVLRRAEAYSISEKKPVLLVSSYKIEPGNTTATFLKAFTQAIQGDEIYYLYKIHVQE